MISRRSAKLSIDTRASFCLSSSTFLESWSGQAAGIQEVAQKGSVYAFFLSLLIIDALILGMVVLLQSGKGGGLSAEFGGASSSTDAFLGGRQTATLLTKMSWWTGGIFLALALILSILSAQSRGPSSILEGQLAPPTQTQELPTPLLQQGEQENAGEAGIPGVGDASQGSGSESPPPEDGN